MFDGLTLIKTYCEGLAFDLHTTGRLKGMVCMFYACLNENQQAEGLARFYFHFAAEMT